MVAWVMAVLAVESEWVVMVVAKATVEATVAVAE
jgi:hypothetical protein